MQLPNLPFTRYRPIEVFAAEDTSAQIVWRGLPTGPLRFSVGQQRHTAHSTGEPGALLIEDLAPNMRYGVDVTGATTTRLSFRTLTRPAGRVLARVATISDLHLGEKDFGLVVRRGEDVEPENRHPIRASKAAVREALDWGAQALMIKGDVTHYGLVEEWEIAEKFLADIDVPTMVAPGNHDTFGKPRSCDAHVALAEIGHEIDGVTMLDVGEVRLLLVDTTVPTHSWGRLRNVEDAVIDAAGTWGGPVLVGLHHHVQQLPVPWFWPLGISKTEGDRFMHRLAKANRRSIVTSGHTHRSRRHTHNPLPYTEVGSTKDYPGVWAGYEFTSNSVRQVVHRVSRPDVLQWTDQSRRAVGGIWGMWSPGTLEQRCFVHEF